jgi:hypothetical protein
MVELRGEGPLQAGVWAPWASLQQGLRMPGITVAVAPVGTGKTTFANQLANDTGSDRTLVFHRINPLNLDDLQDRIEAKLGRSSRSGDLVILDCADNLRAPLTTEWLRRLIERKWADRLHILILTTRPITGAEQLLQQAGQSRHGRVFRYAQFSLSLALLEDRALHASDVSADDRESLISLIESTNNLQLSQTLMQRAEARLSNDRTVTPDLLIVSDRNNRLRALPSSDLGLSDLQLEPGVEMSATPRLTYRSTRGFWLPEAAQLENLINDPQVREHDLQAFFEENPHLLAGTSYDRVVPHPILARDERGPLIPDSMLEPRNGFADILDLKLPGVNLVTGRRDRAHPTALVTEAIAQVREYRAYFEYEAHRQAVKDRYGLKAYRPTVAILIGRDPGPGRDPFELRRIWDELPRHVELMTYDQLLT